MKCIKTYLQKYIRPYFILCIINLVLQFIAQLVRQGEFPLLKYCIGILYSRGTTEWMPNCTPLWFLTALFLALSIFDLIQRVNDICLRSFLILCVGAVGCLVSAYDIEKLPWNMDTAMMGVVFIAIGHKAEQMQLLKTTTGLTLNVLIPLVIAMVSCGVIGVMLNNVECVTFANNHYGNIILMLSSALSFSFLLFFISFQMKWKGIISEFLTFFGQHTLFIMAFDYFSASLAGAILHGSNLPDDWLMIFSLKILILYCGCLLWNRIINLIQNEDFRNALAF